MLPNWIHRERDRAREPKHLWNSEGARGSANDRPPIKWVGQPARNKALSCSWNCSVVEATCHCQFLSWPAGKPDSAAPDLGHASEEVWPGPRAATLKLRSSYVLLTFYFGLPLRTTLAPSPFPFIIAFGRKRMDVLRDATHRHSQAINGAKMRLGR